MSTQVPNFGDLRGVINDILDMDIDFTQNYIEPPNPRKVGSYPGDRMFIDLDDYLMVTGAQGMDYYQTYYKERIQRRKTWHYRRLVDLYGEPCAKRYMYSILRTQNWQRVEGVIPFLAHLVLPKIRKLEKRARARCLRDEGVMMAIGAIAWAIEEARNRRMVVSRAAPRFDTKSNMGEDRLTELGCTKIRAVISAHYEPRGYGDDGLRTRFKHPTTFFRLDIAICAGYFRIEFMQTQRANSIRSGDKPAGVRIDSKDMRQDRARGPIALIAFGSTWIDDRADRWAREALFEHNVDIAAFALDSRLNEEGCKAAMETGTWESDFAQGRTLAPAPEISELDIAAIVLQAARRSAAGEDPLWRIT